MPEAIGVERLKPPPGQIANTDGTPNVAWLIFIQSLCDRLFALEQKVAWIDGRLEVLEPDPQ